MRLVAHTPQGTFIGTEVSREDLESEDIETKEDLVYALLVPVLPDPAYFTFELDNGNQVCFPGEVMKNTVFTVEEE